MPKIGGYGFILSCKICCIHITTARIRYKLLLAAQGNHLATMSVPSKTNEIKLSIHDHYPTKLKDDIILLESNVFIVKSAWYHYQNVPEKIIFWLFIYKQIFTRYVNLEILRTNWVKTGLNHCMRNWAISQRKILKF